MVKGSVHIIVPDHPYYGGDTIHGLVELDVHSTIKSRGVKFFFAAYEYTHWDEPYTYQTVQTFSQKRVFMWHKSSFFVEDGSHQTPHGEVDTIKPGIYRWPFAVELPTLVPPSCKFTHGRIEYKACANVDVQNSNSLEHSILLNVGGNLFDQLAYTLPTAPVHEQNSKKFHFSTKGKLNMEVTLPKFHFFMGEIVALSVDVNNASKKIVDCIKIALETRIGFTAYAHQTKSVHHTHKRAYHLKVEGRERKTLHLQYPLPADETPTTGISEPHADTVEFPQLVKVYHLLQVRLEVPFHVALEVCIPIALMRINPRLPRYQSEGPEPASPMFLGTPHHENSSVSLAPTQEFSSRPSLQVPSRSPSTSPQVSSRTPRTPSSILSVQRTPSPSLSPSPSPSPRTPSPSLPSPRPPAQLIPDLLSSDWVQGGISPAPPLTSPPPLPTPSHPPPTHPSPLHAPTPTYPHPPPSHPSPLHAPTPTYPTPPSSSRNPLPAYTQPPSSSNLLPSKPSYNPPPAYSQPPPPPSLPDSSPLSTTPPLPRNPFPHPWGIKPWHPPERKPVYPVVSGYQYPIHTRPLSLSIGDNMGEHDANLILL